MNKLTGDFPACLDGTPLLLPTPGTHLRANFDQWLDKHRLHPRIIAEFDDGALMKAFGQQGFGVFIAPSDIETEVKRQYKVSVIGRVDEMEETYYAITIERQLTHPVATTVVKAARDLLSAD
jgi:LysR family transcriptional activator of nhaA